MLKELLYDFTLFSLVEGIIYVLFFEKIFDIKKFSFVEYIILSLGNCILSEIYPPLVYQIIMMLWMFIFISVKENKIKLKYLKYVLIPVFYLLCMEMVYNIILVEIFNVDCFNLNNILLFLYMIPVRFLEIIVIIKGGDFMKTWLGTIKK